MPLNAATDAARFSTAPNDGWWRFHIHFNGLSVAVCSVCSCSARVISCWRRVCFGSSCSKRSNSVFEFHLPKSQRNASSSLELLAFDKICLSGRDGMGPLVAGFTCHDQKAVGLKQEIHLPGRILRGKPHHACREQAQGRYLLPKAGLAVDMGRDALSRQILVDDDLIRNGLKMTFRGQPIRQVLK